MHAYSIYTYTQSSLYGHAIKRKQAVIRCGVKGRGGEGRAGAILASHVTVSLAPLPIISCLPPIHPSIHPSSDSTHPPACKQRLVSLEFPSSFGCGFGCGFGAIKGVAFRVFYTLLSTKGNTCLNVLGFFTRSNYHPHGSIAQMWRLISYIGNTR